MATQHSMPSLRLHQTKAAIQRPTKSKLSTSLINFLSDQEGLL